MTVLLCGLSTACGLGGPQQTVADAKADLARNQVVSATLRLRQELRRNPDAAEVRYLLGKILLDTGDAPAADRELRRAQELGFDTDQIRPLRARAALEQGKNSLVLRQFSPEDVGSPESKAEVLVVRAHAQLAQGEADAAGESATRALELVPGQTGALVAQALVKAQRGDMVAAWEQLRGILQLEPDALDALRAAALVAMARGDSSSAIEELQKATALRPTDVVAHYHAVTLLIQQGRNEEAKAQIKVMERKAARQPWLGHVTALLALREGNLAAARDRITEALQANPEFGPSLMLAGNIHSQLGAYERAEQDFIKALAIDPNNAAAHQALLNLRQRGAAAVK